MRPRVAVIVFGLMIVSVGPMSVASAQQPSLPNEPVSIDCSDGEYSIDYPTVAQLYNKNTDAVPGLVKPLIQSNTTKVVIEDASQRYYTVKTNPSMEITSISLGEPTNEDVVVRTDRKTACQLYTTDQPVQTFQRVYGNDRIEINPNGTLKSAAVGIADAVADFIL